MTAKDYRALAWQRLNGRWGMMVLTFFIYSILVSALSYTGIGSFLLLGVLSIGLSSVCLTLSRTGEAKLECLFDGFKGNIANAIICSMLYQLYLALWMMLFIIPGLIKAYSYAMTFYIMRDNPDISANDAITASRKMMNGHKAELFCLHFSFIGWILLGVITCGIGMLFVAPYMEMATAAFYENLKAGQFAAGNAAFQQAQQPADGAQGF
jgi:uncharacterized membrane protein